MQSPSPFGNHTTGGGAATAAATTIDVVSEHCTVASYLQCVKDAMSTIDLLRRTVRMLQDGTLAPLDAHVVKFSNSIAVECDAVEEAMTSCLADPMLEKFVNVLGVAKMLRDTIAQWCITIESPLNMSAVFKHHQQHDDLCVGAVGVLRKRLVDGLETAAASVSMMTILHAPGPDVPGVGGSTDGGRVEAAAGASLEQLIGWLTGSVTRCGEAALMAIAAFVQEPNEGIAHRFHPDDSADAASLARSSTHGPPSDGACSSFATEAFVEAPSPTFAFQYHCSDLMAAIRKGVAGDPALCTIPEGGRGAAQSLLTLMLHLRGLVVNVHEVAQASVDALVLYPQIAMAKEQELRDMAKWYTASAQAAKEWRKENVRRETHRQLLAQRASAMQKELDRHTDEETLLRDAFASRWGAYLPKSGFPLMEEPAPGYTVDAR